MHVRLLRRPIRAPLSGGNSGSAFRNVSCCLPRSRWNLRPRRRTRAVRARNRWRQKFQGIVNQGLLQLSKAIWPFRFESLRPLTAGTDRQSNSTVETYAAIKLRIDNWRWIGVPSASTCRPASPRNASALIVCDTRPLTFFMRNHPLRRSPPLH
jgi:hypothetical protein